jgi:uncharacterized protein YhaN
MVTGDDLLGAEADLARDQAALREVSDLMREAEGALTKVGGDVARERVAELEKALERARVAHHETELDYDAWQLLLEAIRTAENTEGAHLGRALAGPFAERFRTITEGRYAELSLDPNLGSDGLSIAGELRSPSELSVGTREQLETIFRLALATQPGSAIILDDQLVQTDAPRMRHLVKELHEASLKIQVVIVTCRPEDYAGSGDVAHSEIHVVDLTKIVNRHPTVISGTHLGRLA